MREMSYDFASRRSMGVARRGMVATSNPLAVQAGINILRQGGNAADAAIATTSTLNVVEPASTGIGGDCFALYYDAKTKTVTALNGSGRAPQGLSMDYLAQQGITGVIPDRSVHAVTVPGAARGWEDLLKRFGRMTLKDVLQEAIYHAENGYPVAPVFGASWGVSEALLKNGTNTADYLPNGKPPKIGQIVRLEALARTFRAVSEGGADAFYTGAIAQAIVDTLQALGGTMTLTDLKAHTSTWADSISATYHGITVHEHPPNGQGFSALQALKIAEAFDLKGMAWDSPERLHLMIESMRLAFADARYYIADPAVSPMPIDALLDPAYIAERRAMIRTDRAMQPPSFGRPQNTSNTVYLSVVDGDGNACSFINSLYMGFGSGIVAKDTGVFLQNRGANFTLEAGHPNELKGGKRPYHTIIPGMATHNGELWASFGVMGGFMQPQGHFQVINGMVDDDLNPQEALNRPRWLLLDGTADSTLALEDGIPVKTMAKLAEYGHIVKPISGRPRIMFGGGQIIRRDAETGVLFGGTEPRKDGIVGGY